jgi:quercetin dioxygenase-like cupin family protein
MINVEYPPGASDPIHRHNAQAFVYVLKGSIVMQLRSGESVTLTPGQTFYEGPDDVRVVGRNASSTKPAKFSGALDQEQRRSGARAGRVTVRSTKRGEAERDFRLASSSRKAN